MTTNTIPGVYVAHYALVADGALLGARHARVRANDSETAEQVALALAPPNMTLASVRPARVPDKQRWINV